MCYQERLFRSWTTKRAQTREEQPVTERDRPKPAPTGPATAVKTKPRKELDRELEEIA